MTSKLTWVVIDCREPKPLANFWCAVLGYQVVEEEEDLVGISASKPGTESPPSGPVPPGLLFIQVPESKDAKNRLHIDVNPSDREQAEEVERLIGLGARRVDIGQGEQSWVVLADPEGNEFCVLKGRRP